MRCFPLAIALVGCGAPAAQAVVAPLSPETPPVLPEGPPPIRRVAAEHATRLEMSAFAAWEAPSEADQARLAEACATGADAASVVAPTWAVIEVAPDVVRVAGRPVVTLDEGLLAARDADEGQPGLRAALAVLDAGTESVRALCPSSEARRLALLVVDEAVAWPTVTAIAGVVHDAGFTPVYQVADPDPGSLHAVAQPSDPASLLPVRVTAAGLVPQGEDGEPSSRGVAGEAEWRAATAASVSFTVDPTWPGVVAAVDALYGAGVPCVAVEPAHGPTSGAAPRFADGPVRTYDPEAVVAVLAFVPTLPPPPTWVSASGDACRAPAPAEKRRVSATAPTRARVRAAEVDATRDLIEVLRKRETYELSATSDLADLGGVLERLSEVEGGVRAVRIGGEAGGGVSELRSVRLGSAGPPPAPESRGQVTMGTPTSTEDLGVDGAQRVLARYRNQLRYCYERELSRSGPAFEGRVVVELGVGADGRVSRADVTENTTGNASLASCVRGRLRRSIFPASSAESTLTVPIRFAPAT